MVVPNSYILNDFFLGYGGPWKRETEAVIIHKWPKPKEFWSWKIRFKSEVSHSSQYPRTALRGLVKLRVLKVLTISLFLHLQQENQYWTSRSLIQDCKWTQEDPNRELQETSHHRPKEKLNQSRDCLRAHRFLGWSTTSSKLVATVKLSTLDFGDLSEVSIDARQRWSFRHKVGRRIISSDWQTYSQHIGESLQDASWKVLVMRSHPPIAHMLLEVRGHRLAFPKVFLFFFFKKNASGKSKDLKYVVQVYAQEKTLGDKKYSDCRLKVMVQRHLLQKKSRRGQTCNRSSEPWKAKGKDK